MEAACCSLGREGMGMSDEQTIQPGSRVACPLCRGIAEFDLTQFYCLTCEAKFKLEILDKGKN